MSMLGEVSSYRAEHLTSRALFKGHETSENPSTQTFPSSRLVMTGYEGRARAWGFMLLRWLLGHTWK